MVKPGETVPVLLEGGHVIAEGTIVEVFEDKVYIDVPATRVVMGLSSSLTAPPVEAPSVDRTTTALPDNTNDGGSAARDAVTAPAVEPVTTEPIAQVPAAPPAPAQPSSALDAPQSPSAAPSNSEAYVPPDQLDSSALD